MSHFMKSIVDEVMNRTRSESTTVSQEGNEPAKQQVHQTNQAHQAPKAPVIEQSIPGIYRPNYQKQKQQAQRVQQANQSHQASAIEQSIPGIYRPNYQMQKRQDRLSAATSQLKSENRTAANQSNYSQPIKDTKDYPLSSLQRLTLAQINGRY